MGALILGVVLIIGYYYQSTHPIRRIELARTTGYNIYFKAGLSGIYALFYALLIWAVIDYFNIPSKTFNLLNIQTHVSSVVASNEWEYLKVMVITFIMYWLCKGYIKLKKVHYNKNQHKLLNKVLKIADDFEVFIIEKTYHQDFIRVELESGKVYVGIPEQPDIDHGEMTHITILPFLTGYLTKKKRLNFVKNYQPHYEKIFNNADSEHSDEQESRQIEDFVIIIPRADIKVLSSFNIESYTEIEQTKPTDT